MWCALFSATLLFAPTASFTSQRRLPSVATRVTNGRPTALKATVEVFEATQQAVTAASAFVPPCWVDVPWTLADAADAAGVIDPRTYCPNCAAEDTGWFGTGVLTGFHPWGVWRGFVQSSIVDLHDFVKDTLGVTSNSYGLAIMLFTFSLRTLTLPLTYLQFAATEQTKAMQPIMKEIKERFPDQEMQNRVVAKLYEDTETNPLAGCLPPLLQIPVFIALYRSILNLANAKALEEPFFFLPSLEGPTLTEQLQLPQGRGIQWLSEGWVGSYQGGDLVPFLGWEDTLAYCAFPLIIAIGQAVTMKLTTPDLADTATDDDSAATMKRTQAILKYLPLMIGFFSLQVPAALCLYWFTSNTFTTVSTLTIKAYFAANPPVVDWDFLKDAPERSKFQLEMPANIEEALADARLNARPSRVSRRLALSKEALSVETILAADA